MTTIQTRVRVDQNGNVSLMLPIGKADAGREVLVTVAPAYANRLNLPDKEWFDALEETRGAIDDPTFVRPEQPMLEGVPELE